MMIRVLLAIMVMLAPIFVHAQDPVATDVRVRTLVYGENEVFRIVTVYGYQTSIEFAVGEKIRTISIGDPVGFKVTPSENRIFVKTLFENMQTNMSIVTNRRAYQFDLSSKVDNPQDITYVARFFYPEDEFDTAIKGGKLKDPLTTESMVAKQYNFNYALTGPEAIAPTKVFDNGAMTFFKFPNNNATIPAIFAVNPDGSEVRLVTRENGQHIVVENVYPRFALRLERDIVCVFNEGRGGQN